MGNFCANCGKPLKEGAKFCVSCGKPVKDPAAQNKESKKELKRSSEKQTAEKPKSAAQNGGVFSMLTSEIRELLRHPKKLIPTIVLTLIWTVLPIIMGFVPGANNRIVRFISTLTYANGGVLGGFFGTVGGIFGKAVFAAIINGLVLSLCSGKNPFAGFKKNFVGVLSGGTKAASPFLIGGGIGFLLYFFFNITSAPQNCAIAVVCAISAIQTVAKQNGIVFGLVFFTAKKLSKGKAPTRAFVNRVLSGLAAGFVISFPVTFLRYRFLIAILGIIVTAAGLLMPKFGTASGKKLQKTPGTN